MVRLLYGVCGAALGIFFGLFSVWLVVVAIRSLGRDRERGIALANGGSGSAPPQLPLSPDRGSPPTPAPPMVDSLAKLKNSIELGSLGEVVKASDVVPAQTYQTLGKLGTVVSNPRSAERFLSYPGAKELTENPKIVALRDDPEIIELIQEQRFLDLLQNPEVDRGDERPRAGRAGEEFRFPKGAGLRAEEMSARNQVRSGRAGARLPPDRHASAMSQRCLTNGQPSA